MRIAEVHVHKIAIADPPLRSSYGLHQPYALRTILELRSDDGITGIAETYGGEAPAAALDASARTFSAIETASHARGTLGLRIVKGREKPVVEQRVVAFAQISPFTGRR